MLRLDMYPILRSSGISSVSRLVLDERQPVKPLSTVMATNSTILTWERESLGGE